LRYNPHAAPGLANFVLDSSAPAIPLEQYIYNETRYTMLRQSNPVEAKFLLGEAQQDVADRWKRYEALAQEFSATAAATAAKGVQS
jgi:pyruvate-ferredoxin/flavodoxin oxidoreductase